MATSGTVGQTVFTTQQVIDHAYRRMKMVAELISGEKLETALENLWLILQVLSSKGIPVWRIETLLGSLYQNQPTVAYNEAGIVEILNANLRMMTRLEAVAAVSSDGGDPLLAIDGDLETSLLQVAPDGELELDLGQDTLFTTIGVLPDETAVWSYRLAASLDGITWTTFKTYTDQSMVRRQWVWFDVNLARVGGYRYVRIQAFGGATTLNLKEFFVGNNPSAIPMAPLNKDDYFNLPNKMFQGRPVQFWQDMDRDNPTLNLWPVPNVASTFALVESQVHRMIQDVGTMTQSLDLPARWMDWVIDELAVKQAREDPDFKGDIKELKEDARASLAIAQGGIVNKGPIYLQPNISPYTRG